MFYREHGLVGIHTHERALGHPNTHTQTSSHTDEAEGTFEGRKVLHSQKLHAHGICNSN